jgi:hypothetical protein
MIRRAYLIAIALVGLPLFAILFYPFAYSVAASDYGITTTSNIYVGGSSVAGECEKTYMSLNWADLMSDNTSDEWSYKNTWNYITNYDNARQKLDEFHQRFVNNVATGSGWAVAMENTTKYGTGSGDSMAVRVILFDPPNSNLNIDTNVSGRVNVSGGVFHATSFYLNPHANCRFQAGWDIGKQSTYVYLDSTRPIFFIASNNIIYPSDYTGESIPTSIAEIDTDEDGLTGSEESLQGTSDASRDTDEDGLDDHLESQWYPNRDAVFCGVQCIYPDPTAKDVYVEIDWMNNPNDVSYKPSGIQLNQVGSAFATQGINVHFDTGQYGGGNELSTYEQTLQFVQSPSSLDFYDYKSTNFNANRKRAWHYMISGYQYADIPGSSGVSYAGDDDLFVSYGLIKDSQSSFGYTNLDTAIAGTIIHELGHNLCLTGASSYSDQAGECVYSGVDNVNASPDYESSMNYSYQMFMVDYSSGVNGTPADHNDWQAINIGLKDFGNTERDTGDVASGTGKVGKSKRLIQGITIEKAQELRKKNKLGKRNLNYFTRQQMLMR